MDQTHLHLSVKSIEIKKSRAMAGGAVGDDRLLRFVRQRTTTLAREQERTSVGGQETQKLKTRG